MSNGTEQEQSAVSRIHLATMLADIAGCWLSILLAAVVAAMGMYVWVMQTYEPKYEMTASYAVVQKTYDGYMYSGYSTVSYEAATTFKYLIDSDILKDAIFDKFPQKQVYLAKNNQSTVDFVKSHANEVDTVLMIGAGDIYDLKATLAKR